jgi:type II secretory pathway pseudopilin PulG
MRRPSELLSRSGSAFTLVEMLIAVGAVALVGVALAAVFEATGRTVQVGRRVSALNSYAALVEQQMRRDFAGITRQGFLVIRNEMADADQIAGFSMADDVVPLHVDDLSPRPRRTDEVLFFVKGSFATAREALHASKVARADAARVYYGHGKRRSIDTSLGSLYLEPALDDQNNEPFSNLGVADPRNQNRYASEWTLVRHVTLLCPVPTSTQSLPVLAQAPGLPANVLADNDIQIAYQPAASNIFRALAVIDWSGASGIRGSVLPQFTSGLVDIATTDLRETRLVVETADVFPNLAGNQFFDPSSNNGNDGSNAGMDGLFRQYGPNSPQQDPQVVARMQSWMADALPGWSMALNPNQRTRIRVEPSAPNYLGVLADPALTPLETAYQRADQVMLGSSGFLPRCTEFIVEWTFGEVFPSDPNTPGFVDGRQGETIWHGMPRDADGTPLPGSPPTTDLSVKSFPYDDSKIAFRHAVPYRTLDGQMHSGAAGHKANTFLVHGAIPASAGDPLTSYFGFDDPTFSPDLDPPGSPDGLVQSPGDSATNTLPWAWPKRIRVTLGLADPNDPTYEAQYQFVFDLPQEPQR